MAETWDVFISYARADQAWVRTLATNLHNLGLNIFYDEWEIGPGDVLVHRLDEGLLRSRTGVLVVSPAALARPWVQNEYATMMTGAVEGQQRLIPVLLADAAMPRLLASRVWIDFRHTDGPVYAEKVLELARALRGERPGPPLRPDQVQPPPGTGFRAEGPMHYRLQVDRHTVHLLGGPEAVQQPAHPLDATLEQRLWELEQARHRTSPDDPILLRGHGVAGFDALLEQIGEHLGRAFLAGPVAEALGAAIAEATRLNFPLVLGIDIQDEALAALPWETLRLPDQPGPALTLNPRVELYRLLSTPGPVPALAIPGPLRLLVAIGSPEAQNARGELLDMEAELSHILDAVEPAHRAGRGAVVQVLETGSLRAIREALEQRRYHVLYITCHAAPGELVLEDEDGQEVRVSAQRLWTEALAAGRGVPLVVLAGCSTGREGQASATGDLPSVAQALVLHGVPAVLAMQAPVTDRYATALGAALFHALATWEAPLPLRALAAARRQLEHERQQAEPAHRPPPEWATPTLYAAVEPLPLYDPAAPFERLPDRPALRLDPNIAVRRVGEFVGRRREQRVLRRALRAQEHAGVLLHGIGGVGKSTLAAQLLYRLVEEGWWLVSVVGEITPDDLLEAVGKRLLARCVEEGRNDNDPWRRLAAEVRRPEVDWEERLDLLSSDLLEQVSLVLFLDNFEDNLDAQQHCKNPQLADCLRRWLRAPGRSRLLVTCRYPVVLPQRTERQLLASHIGPLSLAETRKLLWRLPGLNALSLADQRRAYADVGGHPRALEYLDALLRGGQTPFLNVAERLEAALEHRGIARPDTWMQGVAGDLDRALVETVTLAADDVLLDQLWDRLATAPLARALLLGAAVYRVPVDKVGLWWQVSEEREPEPDPARQQRLAALQEALTQAREHDEQATLETLGLAPEVMRQAEADLEALRRPPVQAPDGFASALALLQELTLLSPVQLTDDDLLRHTVHRWTAAALARRTAPDTLRQAHHRAARYWLWRVATVPQSDTQDLEELLEARYHHHQAGEIDEAVKATWRVCIQLHTWGAWQPEEQLCRETLTWVPERSTQEAAFFHQLGLIAQRRGAYDEALAWYRRSLALNEELGDRAGIAYSYHQLGIIAQRRGAYDEALEWYRRSLALKEELGDRAGMALSYHQLGIIAQNRGAYDEALEWYHRALALNEELGDRAGMARSYHQLGIIAHARRAYDEALGWYHRALALNEELGDRAGMATSYHQLGMIAEGREAYDEALKWHRRALALNEELGDRAGIAASYHQLGIIAEGREAYDEALEWYHRALALNKELGDRAGIAYSCGQIGMLYTSRGTPDAAVSWNLRSLLIHRELRSPAFHTNLHWLTQQRQMLEETHFLSLLREQLSEDNVQALLRLLDDFASNAQDDAVETATERQGRHSNSNLDKKCPRIPQFRPFLRLFHCIQRVFLRGLGIIFPAKPPN